MYSKRNITVLTLIFCIIFCISYTDNYPSAESTKNDYLISGISDEFYLINNNRTSCTLIESNGKTTPVFHQDNAKILKAITSNLNLYILIEKDELIVVFIYPQKGSMETPYCIEADIETSTFVADDNCFYFVTKNQKNVLKINRIEHSTEEIAFSKNIRTLFYHNETIYAIVDNTVVAIDNPDSAVVSIIPNYSNINPINFRENTYIDNNNKVYSFSRNTGFSYIKTLNYDSCIQFNSTYCTVSGNTVYFLLNNGTIDKKYDHTENIYDICTNKGNVAILSANGVRIITEKNLTKLNIGNKNESTGNQNSQTNDNTIYSKYKIVNNYISVPPGTTISEIKKNINVDSELNLRVYDVNGRYTTSGKLRTGYTLSRYKDNILQDEYIIIIKGDIVGEGVVNTSDRRKLTDYLLDKCKLNDAQKYSSDLNEDGRVDSLDLLHLERKINSSYN